MAAPAALSQQEYAQETGSLDLSLNVVVTVTGADPLAVANFSLDGAGDGFDLNSQPSDPPGTWILPIGRPEAGQRSFNATLSGLDLALVLQQAYPGFGFTIAVVLSLAGDGFVPDSAVFVALGDTELATFTADANGKISGPFTLPPGTAVGEYVITATGASPSGATRVLTAEVSIPEAEAFAPTTTTTTSTTLAPTTTTTSGALPEAAANALLAALQAVRAASS